jgi:hypothetical protein
MLPTLAMTLVISLSSQSGQAQEVGDRVVTKSKVTLRVRNSAVETVPSDTLLRVEATNDKWLWVKSPSGKKGWVQASDVQLSSRPPVTKPKPDTKKPDTKKPDTKKPDTKKPDTKKPDKPENDSDEAQAARPIPVAELKAGPNRFTIHSDTKHHMLEVLWPGPAITVRYRLD